MLVVGPPPHPPPPAPHARYGWIGIKGPHDTHGTPPLRLHTLPRPPLSRPLLPPYRPPHPPPDPAPRRTLPKPTLAVRFLRSIIILSRSAF